MRTMKHLGLTAAAVAALALAGCGGGSSPPPAGPGPTPAPTPVDVSGDLTLSAGAQAALRSFFPSTADGTRTIMIAAGQTETRGGVIFTCASAYPCTVTLRNELDAIEATWASQTLGSGTANVTAMLPANLDVFKNMNKPDADSVKALIIGGFAATATDHDTGTNNDGARVGNNGSVAIQGMGLGDRGPMSFGDMTLRGPFDRNVSTAYVDDAVTSQQGTRGETRAATSGGAVLDDAVAENLSSVDLLVSGNPAWQRTALFSDWGDTDSPNRDGGFETGALVYSDMQAPTSHEWDGDLAGRFVNQFDLPGVTRATGTRNPYQFSVDLLDEDGNFDGTLDTVNDTVAFTVNAATGPAENTHVNANAAGAGTTSIVVTAAADGSFRRVLGQFLGVSGTYTCADATGCQLARASGTANFTLGTGNWQFTPNPGSMVSVPDQDWLAFGAWATTPDDAMNGQHRIGVFFDGMDRYTEDPTGLAGTAEYEGGAAGYYVDGTDAGFFTARATLTAAFGTASEVGSLSGRIDRFRDSAGFYLGDDTARTPNDPNYGGENDWVVQLGSVDLTTDGSAISGTNVSGSADGVSWTGSWSARLYGPGDQDSADLTPPTGIAGNFDAHTAATAADTTRAVTGAFGAQLQPASD